MYPIILITGEAGSGKSTAAEIICKSRNAQSIALADPIKRFARMIFDFTPQQCWGPSILRSQPVAIKALQREIDIPQNMARHLSQWVCSLVKGAETSDIRRLSSKIKAMAQQDTITLRQFLQEVGTDWARKLSPDVWADVALRTAKSLLYGGYSYTPENGLYEDETQKGFDLVVISDGRFRNEILKVKEINGLTINLRRINNKTDNHVSETTLKTIPTGYYDRVIDNNFSLVDLESEINNICLQNGYK